MAVSTAVAPPPDESRSGASATMTPSAHSEMRGGRSHENPLRTMFAAPKMPRVGQSCSIPTPVAIATDIAASGCLGIHSSVVAWIRTSATAAAFAPGASGPAEVRRIAGTSAPTMTRTSTARAVLTRLW